MECFIVLMVEINMFKDEVKQLLMKKRGNYVSSRGLRFPEVWSIVMDNFRN